MVVVPVCLNGRCCSPEKVYRNNKDEGSESLSILVFVGDGVNVIYMKYSKEGRSPSSHVGI